MSTNIRRRVAAFIFRLARKYFRAEFNALVGEVALKIASEISIQMTRSNFIREGMAVCHVRTCTQRFGLRKTAEGYACSVHSQTEAPILAAVS